MNEDLFGRPPEPKKPKRKVSAKASAAGRALRDAGISRVTEAEKLEWRKHWLREFRRFLHDRAALGFTSEDFRFWFLGRPGNTPPHHPNVWGALWMQQAGDDVIEKTGRYLPMQDKRSHARATPEWRRKER